MNIRSAKCFRFKLPLRQPILVQGHRLNSREGILIKVASDEGHVAYGEASPLPFFSKESIDEVIKACRGLPGRLPSEPDARVYVDREDLLPSVRCALDMALRQLEMSDMPTAEQTLPVAGLVTRVDDEGLAEAIALVSEGYASLKIKVGRRDWRADVAFVAALRAELGAGIALRLDANRSWSLDEASSFCRAIETSSIDYLEEPLAKVAEWNALAGGTDTRFALDESMAHLTCDEIAGFKNLAALIIKPGMLGGLTSASPLRRLGKELGLRVTVSSTYESGVATLSYALGALSWQKDSREPAGLDTYRWFEHDVLEQPLELSGGRLCVPPVTTASTRVREDRLEEL